MATEELSLEEFQISALRTWRSHQQTDVQLTIAALGLCGEAGEVAELVKKGIWHSHGLNIDKLKLEIGDVAYYLAMVCELSGLNLGDCLRANIEKLRERYPNGFSVEASRNVVRDG